MVRVPASCDTAPHAGALATDLCHSFMEVGWWEGSEFKGPAGLALGDAAISYSKPLSQSLVIPDALWLATGPVCMSSPCGVSSSQGLPILDEGLLSRPHFSLVISSPFPVRPHSLLRVRTSTSAGGHSSAPVVSTSLLPRICHSWVTLT